MKLFRLILLTIIVVSCSGCNIHNENMNSEDMKNEVFDAQKSNELIDLKNKISELNFKLSEYDEKIKSYENQLSSLESSREEIEKDYKELYTLENKLLGILALYDVMFDSYITTQTYDVDDSIQSIYKKVGIGSNYIDVITLLDEPIEKEYNFSETAGVGVEIWKYDGFSITFSDLKVREMKFYRVSELESFNIGNGDINSFLQELDRLYDKYREEYGYQEYLAELIDSEEEVLVCSYDESEFSGITVVIENVELVDDEYILGPDSKIIYISIDSGYYAN